MSWTSCIHASAAIALAMLLMAVSTSAVLEPAEATEPAVVQSFLASEDACLGADSDTEQCSVSLRQLRGEQQRQVAAAGSDPIDMPVEVASNSSGSGSTDSSSSGMSSGMAPSFPTGTLTGKERTGRGTDYKPHNPDLLTPSHAPLLEFYMYRVTSDEFHPPVNANAANLAGVLWYLHHEVVVTYPRKFHISKIVRLKVKIRPTKPLYEKGMSFGVRGAFDKGQATGPFVCGHEPAMKGGENGILAQPKFCGGKNAQDKSRGVNGEPLGGPYEWSQFGYFVGCNRLGSWPFPTYPVHYPDAVWYSLPGACPSKPFYHRTEWCNKKEPGGYCPGTPTGTGDCTWNYNITGEIYINDLVGISKHQWKRFERHGKKEYDPFRDQGRKFSWWNHINDREANMRRLREAQRLFRQKYPHQTPDENMPHPPCDFDKKAFYEEYYTRNPDLVPCQSAWEVPKCRDAIQHARKDIRTQPWKYPGLKVGSPDRDFQKMLWKNSPDSECPKPCK